MVTLLQWIIIFFSVRGVMGMQSDKVISQQSHGSLINVYFDASAMWSSIK